MSLINLEVKNWAKFQEREDRANYVWFKFSNSFFSDPKLFPLTIGARFLFVYILCERSKSEGNVVSINLEMTAFTLRATPEKILSQLEELREISVIFQETPGNSRTDACLDKKDKKREDKKDKMRGDAAAADTSPKVPHPIVKLWNENRGPLAGIRGCSASRLKHINSRWSENPSEAFWLEAVKRIAASSFCVGKNDRGWKADFDFLIKPDTAHKALEGKYDDRQGVAPTGGRNYATEREAANRAAADAYLKTLEVVE